MTVDIKEYLLKQIDTVVDFIKENTARKNGTETETFKAKVSEQPNDVIVNSQVSDVDVSEATLQQQWDEA